MKRRQFIRNTAGFAVLSASGLPLSHAAPALKEPSPKSLPRWRGFNLLEKFTKQRGGNPAFKLEDFQLISELGFDFVRLPMSYLCWSDPSDWLKIREDELKHIDQAIDWGEKYGIHVNLNFHRAPGYCVNPPKEPLDLWTNAEALDACATHWACFARRYRGLPNSRLSFDLMNEPGALDEPVYARVVKRLVEAIRAEDTGRLIIADGLRWGTKPVPSLAGLQLGQSTRGYEPMRISHYKANWVGGSDQWPEPTWPLKLSDKEVFDKERLRRERIEPWKALERSGTGVHVGEFGAYNRTPHAVALAWLGDCLDLWKEAGWGWAMWNFRGSFGILDSARSDMAYEDFKGHKLDRKLLKLLQAG